LGLIASREVELIVRAVGKCYLSCPHCNWNGEIREAYLRESSLELLLDILIGEGYKPEVYFSCPDPLLHPSLSSLISAPIERGLKSTVLVPARTRSDRKAWESLLNASRIFIFSSSIRDLRGSKEFLKFLISNGSDLKLMFLRGSKDDLNQILEFARDMGLELWVAPPLFRIPKVEGLDENLELGKQVAKFMGIYDVRIAFKGDFPFKIIEGPRCEIGCKLLYLDPEGRLGRCPFNAMDQLNSPPLEAIRILDESCERGEGRKFELVPSIKLITGNGEEIYERDLELLSLIEELGSLSQAARTIGATPSSIFKRIRRMEGVLGFRLITSSRGGYLRGGVRLTPECEGLVRRYRELKVSIINRYRLSLMEKLDG